MAVRAVVLAFVWCALVAHGSCCAGNSTLGEWEVNSFTVDCPSVVFTIDVSDASGLLIAAVYVEGAHSLKISCTEGYTTTTGTTDPETGEGQICVNLSEYSVDELEVTVIINDTMNATPFEFYYDFETNCRAIAPPIGSSSASPVLMEVVCNSGVTVTPTRDRGRSVLQMTPTTVTAFPAPLFVFNCNGHVLLYEIELSDTQYVTSMGVCTYGDTCTSNDGFTSWSAWIIDPSEPPTNASVPSAPTGPFISFEEPGGQISTVSALHAVVYDGALIFPQSQLPSFLTSFPPLGEPKVVLSEYQMFPQDESAIVTFNMKKQHDALDFYAFVECIEHGNYYHCGEFDVKSSCFPELSLVVEQTAEWEEQVSLELFDIL